MLKKSRIIELFSYPVVGIIYIISWFPIGILYLTVSKLLFFLLYYIPGYRKNIVYQNLSRSFPGKDHKELITIRRKFYIHLSNIIVEIIKLLSFSPAELERRCCFTNETRELMNSYFSKNTPVIVVIGHYGNWEWGGASFYPNTGENVLTAYRPVKNRVFDNLMKHLRQRFGIRVIPMNDLPRKMFTLRHEITATALIADQTPSPSNAHWLTFLGQDTPVFKGTAKLAKLYNYPLIFCSVRLKKKGYYEVHGKLIVSKPKDYDETTLTSLHTQMLEEEITNAPEYWLWTHRRWKHRRSE